MTGVKGRSGNTQVGQSGYYGVHWHKAARKWSVYIRIEHERVYLGLYEDKIEAAKAYDREARKLGKKLFNFEA